MVHFLLSLCACVLANVVLVSLAALWTCLMGLTLDVSIAA